VRFAAQPRSGASYFQQNVLVVSFIGRRAVPTDTLSYKTDFGATFEVERDGLVLRLRSNDAAQPLVICRPA
jgi:hypothetical protein